MDLLRNGNVQLLIMVGIIVLSFTAEKCRQLAPEEALSRTRTERFRFSNCFDKRYGTLACTAKVAMKLYLFEKYDINRRGEDSTLLAKHNMGVIVSTAWDFFETIYVNGTIGEGFSRASGTFIGAYVGGFIGANQLGRLGFRVGSPLWELVRWRSGTNGI
ncbi:hypothetical protein L1049_004470 [Liquidambar formosana]|uniref:Glycine zipper 2TM domain-containing protein n=1 Tax=Liquidambar formosana TaxID=63359 RepID=A0AAP0RSK0_LIQFO